MDDQLTSTTHEELSQFPTGESGRIITSTACYFPRLGGQLISPAWLEHVTNFFSEYQLSIDRYSLWTADGNTVTIKRDQFNGPRLHTLISQSNMTDLMVYCYEHPDVSDAEQWIAMASLELPGGMSFLGVAHRILDQAGLLLRRHLDSLPISSLVRYGIGYYYPHANSPDSFAAGVSVSSLSALFAYEKRREAIQSWLTERQGRQRYLHGYMRSVYPANLLSRRHTELVERFLGSMVWKIGDVSAVGDDLWLWELSNEDILRVDHLLRPSGILLT